MLSEYYLDDSRKDLMLAHWTKNLKVLVLDEDTDVSEFMNNFEMYVRKIEKIEGKWSDFKKLRKFKS